MAYKQQQQQDISYALSAESEAAIDEAQNASLPKSDEDENELKQQIEQNQTPQQSQEQQKAGTPPSANELNQRRRKLEIR